MLVTGATGFIGRRVVARLSGAGVPVRALVLPGEAVPASWPASVDVARGDIADASAVAAAARGAGSALHLAAVVADWGDGREHDRVTVGGTQNLLDALPAGARLVLVSSVVVYGDALARDVCAEDHPGGEALGPYGRSKRAQEALVFAAARARPVAIVRPGNVFGAGSGPWVRDLVAQLAAAGPVLIGGGTGDAGLCDVENLVDLLELARTHDAALGRAFNANDGGGVSWRRYCEDLARVFGTPPPRAVSYALASAGARTAEGAWRLLKKEGRPPITREALNLLASDHRVPIERARRELGFTPRRSYEEVLLEIAASSPSGAPPTA